jgi:integrase/recombinase XerD
MTTNKLMVTGYKGAKNRLESLPEKNRERIKEFIQEKELSVGLNALIALCTQLKVIAEFMGDRFLNPEKKDVIAFMASLKDKKDTTKNQYIVTLKEFYKWHEELDKGEPSPKYVRFLEKKQIDYRHGKEENITRDEVVKILEKMTSERDKVITQTLFDSGCRVSEVLALKRKDLSFSDKGTVLRVAGREEGARKTGSRDVFLFGDSVPMLKDYLRGRPQDPESYVFPMLYGDKSAPCDYYSYVRLLKKAVKDAGITKRVHAHMFRHTRASYLVAKGINQAVLESQLGWATASKTARVYINLKSDDIRKRMNELMGISEPVESTQDSVKTITCPRCSHENPSYAKSCSQCWFPLDIEKALQFEARQEKAVEVLKKTDIIGGTEKALLEAIHDIPELESELLLALLKGLKASGKFENLKKMFDTTEK